MTTTTQYTNEVRLLRWPAEAAQRERCRAMGVLRLLVVEGGAPAPVCADVREDWVRAPISDDDLMARVATLRARTEAHRLPHVDPHGMLQFGGQTTTVSRTETDLLECLVRQFGQPVSRDILRECLPERPGGTSRNALDLHIMRLRRRIGPLGLVIRTVWGRGYLLAPADAPVTVTRPTRVRQRISPAQRDAIRRAEQRAADAENGRTMAPSEVAALRWSQHNRTHGGRAAG